MKARMERILRKLAHQHVPHLLNNLPADIDARLRVLANGLAKNGVLVIAGQLPPENLEQHVSYWVGGYNQMFTLLAKTLFPSLANLNAVYADDNYPPIVVIEGSPAVVVEVLGRYVAPYLALRQKDNIVSEAELRGVMMFILDKLDGNNLDGAIYTYLWQEGVKILNYLLRLSMTHYAVTSFAQNLFQQIQQEQVQVEHVPPQQTPPEQHQTPPPPPELLPDEPPPVEETDTDKMFKASIPLFPVVRRRRGDTGPLPPVPPLPNRDED